MHFIWAYEHKPLWFLEIEWFWGTFIRFSKKICYLVIICFEILKGKWSHSLWFETWKYITQRSHKVWYQNYRFWKLLFLGWKSLYLYIIKILQSTRNYFRYSLYHKYWHVVIWVYNGRVLYRLSNISRWRWDWITCFDNGSLRYSFLRSSIC